MAAVEINVIKLQVLGEEVVLEYSPPQPKPEPQTLPVLGWQPGPNDIPCMVNHNGYWGPLRYSNETIVAHEYQEEINRVVPGKIIVQLHRRPDWQQQMERMNNLFILTNMIQRHWGICDSGEEPEGGRIPYTDNPIPFGCSIDMGGNRRNGKRIFKDRKGKWHIEVETQNWDGSPNQLITYLGDPQLCVKQVDFGLSVDTKEPFWRTGLYDVEWMWVSNVPTVHELTNVTLYPQANKEPINCFLHGYPVEIEGLFLSGSDTWVHVSDGELETGWYQADGYPPPIGEPEPGRGKNYFCHISGVTWPQITPPVAGWKKS